MILGNIINELFLLSVTYRLLIIYLSFIYLIYHASIIYVSIYYVSTYLSTYHPIYL